MSNLTSKLFVGCLISPDMLYALGKNAQWKEELIIWQSNPLGMKAIRFEGQHYFGKYIEEAEVPLSKIKEIENEIRQILEKYFPEFSNKKQIVIFPHFFAG